MRVPRFFVGDELELTHNFWVHDSALLHEWHKMHLHVNDEVVLFDGVRSDRLYRITQLNQAEAHVEYVTDYERQVPEREVYVLWFAGNVERDEAMIRTGVELGASHFLPLMHEGQEDGIDVERYLTCAIQALEQTERSDVPVVRGLMTLKAALHELQGRARLLTGLGEESGGALRDDEAIGILVGVTANELDGTKVEKLSDELIEKYQVLLSM